MTTAATRQNKVNASGLVLHLALELDGKSWKMAFSTGLGQRPRLRQVKPGDVGALLHEVEKAKQRFGLPVQARVVSCYEAGRDGFWLHRFLLAHSVENVIVDAASIEVSRRWRRAKTDWLDAAKLLERLIKYSAGSKEWKVVRVPDVEAEDARHVHRELEAIKHERTAVTNRIKSLLATQGLKLKLRVLPVELETARLWDGTTLPQQLRARLLREWEHWQFLTQRIRQVEAARRTELRQRTATGSPADQIRKLERMRSVGIESATLLVHEVFAWRKIRNRRQIGALSGLAPTPYSSGGTKREQGIGKSGNPRVRRCMVELAWMWLRFQPQSGLTQWYNHRFASGGPRQRKIGIVALARKLLIALWQYLEAGVLPEGAVLKA